MTLAVSGVPLGQFLRLLAVETGLSFVWSEELDQLSVSVEVDGVEVVSVLDYVARRLDVDLTREGNLFFLGDARERDRGLLVRRLGRLGTTDVEGVLSTVITDFGEFYVSGDDGLLVVTEHLGVLRRVSELLDQVESLGRSSWVVQLYMVSSSSSSSSELGFDTSIDLDVATAFASSASGVEYAGEARAALLADINRQKVDIFARPLFVLLDGGEAVLKRGRVVPVPEYTTLETGAVVTSGYTEIDVGLSVTVRVREWSRDQASLSYDLRLGEIVGYVDDRVPIRVEDELTGELVVSSGGTYLVGSLDRQRRGSGRSGIGQVAFSRSHDGAELEVWAMVTRVSPTGMSDFQLPADTSSGGVSDVSEGIEAGLD